MVYITVTKNLIFNWMSESTIQYDPQNWELQINYVAAHGVVKKNTNPLHCSHESQQQGSINADVLGACIAKLQHDLVELLNLFV